jgi:hypothetical protein
MRDHNSAVGYFRSHDGQSLRYVFVGESMEPITPYSFSMKALRNGEPIGHFGVVAVKSGIKAGNLQDVRLPFQNCADRGNVVWLMQRRQWDEPVQFAQQGFRDGDRSAMSWTTMYDAMADGDR